MDISGVIGEVKDFASKVKDNYEDFKPALAQGKEALAKAQDLFQKLEDGKVEEVQAELTKWDDVNKTNQARAAMKGEIAKNPIEFEDVLDVVGKVARVAGVIAKAAAIGL